jgi:fatty-acyl-CoA synthase
VKIGVTGGSPIPVDRARAFEETFGKKLCEIYAMTETAGSAVLTPRHGERVDGSAGLRAPYTEVKAVKLGADGAVGEDCAPGESGVILLRGPSVTPGYTDPRLDAGVLVEGGWLVTGDLGRVNADGRVWITGRAKDLIIRGGHNIDPAAIEEAVEGHPAVMMSAAVGMPDEYAGELPALFVKLKPGARATGDELHEWLVTRIPERPALPKAIRVLAELPLTPVGKVFKPALRCVMVEEVLADRLDRALAGHGVACNVEARLEPSGVVASIRLRRSGNIVDVEALEKVALQAVSGFAVARTLAWADAP